jgi:hypothetical protein
MRAVARQSDLWSPGAGAARKRHPAEARAVAFAVAGIDFAVGAYINLSLHYIKPDAFSRVANAFYVLYSRTPHLGAVGFVWNPLPSLLELILVPFKAVWPPLVTSGLASVVVSAAFGGIAAYLLLCILAEFGLGSLFRVGAALLFAANPLILLYSANGMTGVMLVATMLGTLLGLIRFLDTRSLASLTAAAIWLAVGFGIRYEAAPYGALVALALMVSLRWKKVSWSRIRSTVLVLAAPLIYVSGLWIYFNWLVMKNPLFFMDGTYSNAAFSAYGSYGYPLLSQLKGHPLTAFAYVAGFTLLFWPVIPGIAISCFHLFGRRKDPRVPLLLAANAAIPLLQFALLERGLSSGVDRYFMYYIPIGFLLIGLVVSKVHSARLRSVLMAFALIVLALGDAGTGYAIYTSPILGHGDRSDLIGIVSGNPTPPYVARDKVVAYLNAHPHLTVLTDSAYAYPIILRVNNPHQLIIDSDSDFNSILYNPRGRVDAFLVPEISAGDVPDAVTRAWPQISNGKLPWVQLVASFRGGGVYQLFRIKPNAP